MPSSIKDFVFIKQLGKGSFGVVHKVKRIGTLCGAVQWKWSHVCCIRLAADGQFYVIKQLHIAALGRKEQEEAINEVRILAALDHPNVTRYYDSFIEDGMLNIVMELAEHGTLHDRLKVY